VTPLPGWTPFVQPTPQFRTGAPSPFDPVKSPVPVASALPGSDADLISIVAVEPEVPRSFWNDVPPIDDTVIVADDDFVPIDFGPELPTDWTPIPPPARGSFFLALLLAGGAIIAARSGVI
jgi:hypothetical protein